jgi:hypothetical protein
VIWHRWQRSLHIQHLQPFKIELMYGIMCVCYWNISPSYAQGYFYKAAALGEDDLVTVADTADVVLKAQLLQTIGMRLLFFFPVTVCLLLLWWGVAKYSLLCTSCFPLLCLTFLLLRFAWTGGLYSLK